MTNTNSNATSQTTESVTASGAIGSSVDSFDGRVFATKKLNIILDDDNYLLWQQQVLLAAKTFKLQGYLDGTLDYLLKIKSFCDNLANCGEMVSEYEHVTAILNGLSADFEYVITIISASPIPYSVQTVSTLLLDAEARQQT
ncbi:hypothetical protein Gogos_000111, partial [Gossypium gossypioides]|nr:hypothetical protein [Gossypium gossypioides]